MPTTTKHTFSCAMGAGDLHIEHDAENEVFLIEPHMVRGFKALCFTYEQVEAMRSVLSRPRLTRARERKSR